MFFRIFATCKIKCRKNEEIINDGKPIACKSFWICPVRKRYMESHSKGGCKFCEYDEEVEHALTSSSSLSFGAQYSQQGVAESAGGYDVVFKMDYINVPVTVSHYFSPKFAIFAGLQPGFLVDDAVKVSYGGESVTVNGIKKYMESEGIDVSSFALSVPVGLAFTFGQVKMDVKYAYELTNTLSQGSEKSRHSYFQVTLGYKFDL